MMQRNLFFLFIVCALVPHTASSNYNQCGVGSNCQPGFYTSTPGNCAQCGSADMSVTLDGAGVLLSESEYGRTGNKYCCYALCPPKKITEEGYGSGNGYNFFGCRLPSNNNEFDNFGRIYYGDDWTSVCKYGTGSDAMLYCLGEDSAENFNYDGDHISCKQMLQQADYDGFDNACHGARSERVNGVWTCVLNRQEFENMDKTLGFTVHDPETDTEKKCITTCPDDTHAENSGTELCGVTCKICIPNELNCTGGDDNYKDIYIPDDKCPNSTISGKITWSDGAYDYSQCTCSSEGTANFDDTGNAGRGTFICTGYDHSNGTWDTCNINYESCPKGRCSLAKDVTLENVSIADACPDAPTGYYHSDENSWSCSPCPLGSTTHGPRRTSINQCVMVGPGTGVSAVPQFCDNIGCFILPERTDIYYAGEEAL